MNPRYTGHQVWNRQRKEEMLIDVEDVALGHETKMKWNPESTWVFSDRQVHEPLVSKRTFDAVQRRRAGQGPRSSGRQVVRTQHGYAFKSRLVHKSCGRRMQGNWAHGEPYYRCRFPQEYAIANKVDHPLNVYLREDDLRAQVDPWLAEAFAPSAIEHTLTTLDGAQPSSDGQSEALRKKIAECDRKIAQHRAVLEAGGDPQLVAGWTWRFRRRRRPRRHSSPSSAGRSVKAGG
jgi:site-specific DNA recombinase